MVDVIHRVFIDRSPNDFLSPEEQAHLIRTAKYAMDDRERAAAKIALAVAFGRPLRAAADNYMSRLARHGRRMDSLYEIAGPLFIRFYDLVEKADEEDPVGTFSHRVKANLMDAAGEAFLETMGIDIPWRDYIKAETVKNRVYREELTEEEARKEEHLSAARYAALTQATTPKVDTDHPLTAVAPSRGIYTRMEDRILADAALGLLTPKQSAIMLATYGDYQDTKDIAEELGLTRQEVTQERKNGLDVMRRHFGLRG